MNAPVLLAMPQAIRRARLSAIDGAPLGEWHDDDALADAAPLDTETIDLWLFDLDGDAAVTADPIQRREARGHAARRRLRQLLARALGRDEDEIEWSIGARGKPVLRSSRTPPLFFNASRSGPLALVAIARAEIGVDIERRVHRTMRHDAIGDESDPIERLRRWTRCEAVAKATGIGLGIRLRTPLGTPEGSVQFGGTLWGWRDVALPAEAQAIAAIAYREGGQRRCG